MGCPFGHYTKLVGTCPVDLRGHPIVCYSSDLCTSTLRILRAASTHYPILRKFLSHVISALSAHKSVCDIDNALQNGNHQSLIIITHFESLLSCNVDQNYQKLKSTDLSLKRYQDCTQQHTLLPHHQSSRQCRMYSPNPQEPLE